MNSIEEDVKLIGLNQETWKKFKEHYVQDDLPNFLKAEAEARESGISKIQKQDHLAKWGIKFEKYANFSKDPEFKKRMFKYTKKCFDMMNGHER